MTVDLKLFIEQMSSDAVSLTASVCTTIADEMILLIRKLHVNPAWSDMINLTIWKCLCLVTEDNIKSTVRRIVLYPTKKLTFNV